MIYKHKTYNPMWAGLSMLCVTMENEGWMLSHIVPVNQYEAVAVFARSTVVETTESEVKFPGDYL